MRLIASLSFVAAGLGCFSAGCAVGAKQVGGFDENGAAVRDKVDTVDVAETAKIAQIADAADAADAAVDSEGSDAASVPGVADSGAAVNVSAGECMREIEFGAVRASNLYCVTNESVANARGMLRYPCGKSDNVTVTFGKQTFRGSIEGNRLSLMNVETFRFIAEGNPSCRWRSTQVLYGNLEQGPLTYEYTESVVTPGLCTAKPCTASGTVQVASVSKEISSGK